MFLINLQALHLHFIPEKDLRPDLKLARVVAFLNAVGIAAQSLVPWKRMEWSP